jgi:hypothetical protein
MEKPTLDERAPKAPPAAAPEVAARIVLSRPVKDGDKTITEVVFPRRLLFKDALGVRPTMTTDFFMLVASRATGVPLHVLNELDAADGLAVVNQVMEFFEPGPATG